MITSETHSVIYLTCEPGTYINKAVDEGCHISTLIKDVTHVQFMNGKHIKTFTG